MSPLAQAVSAALIHFVWQGALVGVLLWVALAALRNRAADARYAVSCAALAVLVVAPAATAAAFIDSAVTIDVRAVSMVTSLRALVAPQPMLSIWMNAETPSSPWLAQLQWWALPVWSVGVFLFSMRLTWSWTYAFALGRSGNPPDELILDIVRAVGRRLGIARPVRVLMSTLTDVPCVLGWLRPVILLTPAAAMGLTPSQLAAVIAHELAHVKRWDYLVNLFQVVAETVFFYHPAVWWISSRIRLERELCCDDLAVHSCGDALCYARALTALEKQRVTAPAMVMASTGGPLLYRIQRLMGESTREYGPSRWPGVIALCVGLVSVTLNVNWVRAQAQKELAPRLTFEVASIKLNKSGPGLVNIGTRAGRFTATNVTLRMLLRNAYGLQDSQMSGGPSWIDTDRFDVVTKADGNATYDQVRAMLRTLLEDRFKLNVRTESRTLPVYALVLARNDGRVGGELKKSGSECKAITMWPGAPPPPPPPPGPPIAGRTQCPSMLVQGNVSARDVTMERLATMLSSWVNRFVMDRTGLSGSFDFDLHWAPDQMPAVRFNDLPPSPVPIDPNGPSLFTALQEQLGLKLDSQRGPVDILVIDRAERPTED